MTYAPTDRLQQAVSFGQSRKRTYRTNSQKDYVQPTKFVLRTDGFMHKAILLGATPYELSWFKKHFLGYGGPGTMPDFYSQKSG